MKKFLLRELVRRTTALDLLGRQFLGVIGCLSMFYLMLLCHSLNKNEFNLNI